MIRTIAKLLRLSRVERKPLPFMRVDPGHLVPVEFGDGCINFHTTTIQRLEHLHSLGMLLREQQEAAAAECCQLLDCDPASMACDADYARSIVDHGEQVSTVIEQILHYRESRRDNASI